MQSANFCLRSTSKEYCAFAGYKTLVFTCQNVSVVFVPQNYCLEETTVHYFFLIRIQPCPDRRTSVTITITITLPHTFVASCRRQAPKWITTLHTILGLES